MLILIALALFHQKTGFYRPTGASTQIAPLVEVPFSQGFTGKPLR